MDTECPVVLHLPPKRNNPRNSEGAFVTLADGRVLFAYSRYRGSNSSDHAPAVIAARVSPDGGRTWSRKDRVLVEQEGDMNVMSVSLQRLRDGRIALFYLRKNSLHDARPHMRTSEDEGATWGDPVPCIRMPGYFVLNNDRVVQLRSGRLVLPAAYHRPREPVHTPKGEKPNIDMRGIMTFWLSDDAGATWREAEDWWALPKRSGMGLQEPGTVELKGGRLYGWARTDTGRQWETLSRDGGETWRAPAPSRFRSPCSPLSIKRLATGDLLAVWNDHAPSRAREEIDFTATSSWGRTPLAVAISKDEGRTWRKTKNLEEDPARGFCYIAIHPLEDAVLLAYCSGGGGETRVLQETTVRRVSHEWLYA